MTRHAFRAHGSAAQIPVKQLEPGIRQTKKQQQLNISTPWRPSQADVPLKGPADLGQLQAGVGFIHGFQPGPSVQTAAVDRQGCFVAWKEGPLNDSISLPPIGGLDCPGLQIQIQTTNPSHHLLAPVFHQNQSHPPSGKPPQFFQKQSN